MGQAITFRHPPVYKSAFLGVFGQAATPTPRNWPPDPPSPTLHLTLCLTLCPTLHLTLRVSAHGPTFSTSTDGFAVSARSTGNSGAKDFSSCQLWSVIFT